MLLLEIDELLKKYSWLKDMVNYTKRLNRQVNMLEDKASLTKREKLKLKKLYAMQRVLNPAMDFYIECGLRNPEFLCMYLYYEYKQSVREGANIDVIKMFERIRKDYFSNMKQYFEGSYN